MIVYTTGHASSDIVCEAMAKGFGGRLQSTPWPRPLTGPAAFYGRDRGTLQIPRTLATTFNSWYMADNGYITPRWSGDHPKRYDGYYKISRDGFQCDGMGEPDYDRLKFIMDLTKQRITETWRKPTKDGHILICPPIVEYERVHWHSHTHWVRWVKSQIRSVAPDRKFRMRYKPGDPRDTTQRDLKTDFSRCHAVVTHDSNIAVEATMEGIPCFVVGISPAHVFGNIDIMMIENPLMEYDRTLWLATLAANQWTLKEIADGMMCKTVAVPRAGP